MTLTIGSLFAGYGGLDLGIAAALDARTAWVSEIDPGACKVLAHRFPHAPNLGDVTTIDWGTVPRVDIIAGGSPCQDLSTAGRRAGMTEGTRSNLWVAMREAIARLQPTYVIWENVRGAYSATAASDLEPCAGCVGDDSGGGITPLRALGRVLGDLAGLGYDAQWHGLRAADIGAPHGRYRVFLLATRRGAASPAADAYDARPQGSHDPQGAAQARLHGHSVASADGDAVRLLPTPTTTQRGPDANLATRAGARANLHNEALQLLPTPTAGHRDRSESTGLSKLDGTRDFVDLGSVAALNRWGDYAAAIARHEQMIGRPAPAPTEPGHKGKPRLAARFVEWMMGLPAGWVTGIDGVSRANQLQMLGNGVVPQQAAAALRIMLSRASQEVAA